MSETPAVSSLFATALLAALIEQGVRDVVVCPGSRSQALALAAAEAERAGAIRLHVRVDERSAAFFALGAARETGMPAPVIVTSGGAVANLMPAVVEAHEGRVPMLLLTADRPAALRGTRSNQTTRQAGIGGDFTRLNLDRAVDGTFAEATPASDITGLARQVLSASRGGFGASPAGPVQLNLQFTEPLSGWTEGETVDFGAGEMTPREVFSRIAEREASHEPSQVPGRQSGVRVINDDTTFTTVLLSDTDTYVHDGDSLAVVIAGADAGAQAEEFAREAGLPLLAEVVSGARFGREAITAYATLIDDPAIGGLIERAIVFGHPTLTRQVPALLRRDDVAVIVVDPHEGEGVDRFDPSGRARVVGAATVAESYDPTVMRRWLGAWVVADRELRAERTTVHAPDLEAARETGYKEMSQYARAEVAVKRERITRELLTESVWRATWPHDRLVLAASRLVRVLDGVAAPRRVNVHSNRGLAGIDGTVATALGIAVASQGEDQPSLGAGVTRVLLGDLALLHDAGSLLLPEAEAKPRVQLFVGNDGGGTIFDTLEAAATTDAEAFDRVMYTPQQADLAALAGAYGWSYRRIETRGELENLLTEPVTGPELIEVPLDR